MSFVSPGFLLFFPLVVIFYFVVRVKWRWLFLLLSSYLFYGYYTPAYIPLLLLSTGVDFFAGKKIGAANTKQNKRKWLYFSVFFNLALLFFFKYYNFFGSELSVFLSWMGMEFTPYTHELILPLGISFYTFQTLSYSIDIYRGYLKPERHFGRFALYVSFFPQLVAGPIERARRLLPQLHLNYGFDYVRVKEGAQLMLWGFFKKLVVADRFGMYADQVFDMSNGHSGPVVFLGGLLFGLQILFDFAGYSEIAIGMARILGIRLSRNFGNIGFFSSPVQMWAQWHITLTSWFRDYLYFPLTKRNSSSAFKHFALIITFLITGFWHGAAWGFIIWGALHGVYLVVDHLTAKPRKQQFDKWGVSRYPKVLALLGFLVFVPFNAASALFFRAKSLSEAWVLLKEGLDWSILYFDVGLEPFAMFLILVLVVATEWFGRTMGTRQIHEFLREKGSVYRWSFYLIILNMILFLRPAHEELGGFIYFGF